MAWQAPWIRAKRRSSSLPSRWLAAAQASFKMAKAWMRSGGIFSSPMGKFSRLRWVWAPQSLSAGTATWPMVSCSMRYSMVDSSLLAEICWWSRLGPALRGPTVIGRWLRWNHCRVDPATWVPRRRPRGSPAFFGRKPEERTPGASPWTPGFDGRSLPLAGFCGGCLCNGRGAISSDMLRPIWDAFSGKNMLKSILAKESSQIRVRRWVP